MVGGYEFEIAVAKCLNRYYGDHGIAIRMYQAQYVTQYIDILLFSCGKVTLIECKSTKHNKMYFGNAFNHAGGVSQVTRIQGLVTRSGSKAYLALEFRKNTNSAYMIPWQKVFSWYSTKFGGISEDIAAENGIELERERGEYYLHQDL